MILKNNQMTDNQRQTHHDASIKNVFYTTEEVVSTKVVPLPIEKVIDLMINKSPVHIYNTQYSRRKPCIIITKQIMPSDGGVYMYYDSWGNKTGKFVPWEQFYRQLILSGPMDNWKF